MRGQDGARMPTPVLVGLLVVGLGLGAAWWTTNAPPAGEAAATGEAAYGEAASGEAAASGPARHRPVQPLTRDQLERPTSPREYRLRAGADGVAHSFAVSGETPSDPADLVLALEPGTLEWLLPSADAPVVRGGVLLGRGASHLVEGPGATGAFRLEIACTGGAELQVEIISDHTTHRASVACDARPATIDLRLLAGYAGVRFTHPDEVDGRTGAAAGSLLLAVCYQLLRR